MYTLEDREQFHELIPHPIDFVRQETLAQDFIRFFTEYLAFMSVVTAKVVLMSRVLVIVSESVNTNMSAILR